LSQRAFKSYLDFVSSNDKAGEFKKLLVAGFRNFHNDIAGKMPAYWDKGFQSNLKSEIQRKVVGTATAGAILSKYVEKFGVIYTNPLRSSEN
jgi:hypothetical protein